ncbi:histidine phosphatase family containing protein [Rhizoctonia solani AG-3 Rhs1AP]|uniref:Histidine phosphatase family containing protein n=2 Tax=Rhizoctonia solani AG-3 TaxID=1086053 RepID=A0A074S7T9_9AGAM|nr:histidine phosphatase family containing protein [Rhizoctonia solani AG-3 Rhs1AP]KEP55481.1 histidine phosphatase family containing protein [Rhizoctonia solani 123E]
MDTQLNDAGREQAKITGRSLKDVHFVKAYSSDSSRAADVRHGIYNTSISIVRMRAAMTTTPPLPSNDGSDVEESQQPTSSVSGVLVSCASIAHLIKKRDIVVENADLLGQ